MKRIILLATAFIGTMTLSLLLFTKYSPITQAPVKPKPTQANFNIESFYGAIKTGMHRSEVEALASGQPNQCIMTDSYPESVNCLWESGDKSVNVSFGSQDSVGAKSKTGF